MKSPSTSSSDSTTRPAAAMGLLEAFQPVPARGLAQRTPDEGNPAMAEPDQVAVIFLRGGCIVHRHGVDQIALGLAGWPPTPPGAPRPDGVEQFGVVGQRWGKDQAPAARWRSASGGARPRWCRADICRAPHGRHLLVASAFEQPDQDLAQVAATGVAVDTPTPTSSCTASMRAEVLGR